VLLETWLHDRSRRIGALAAQINKPWYLYRPSQILTRMRCRLPGPAEREITLPWGSRLRLCVNDHIGAGIARTGAQLGSVGAAHDWDGRAQRPVDERHVVLRALVRAPQTTR
jgi:hypothetical protein